MTSQRTFYVAVHGGAGQHGRASEAQVKCAMKRACTEALQIASKLPCTSALSIVELTITILEDEGCLNAGYGSNLTFQGTVECDAAIMDGRTGDFGSVGAVKGVKNPIKLANAILAHARMPDRLGRIRPLTLVSSGARAFAQRNGVETVDETSMVAPNAREDWERWMKRYDEVASTDELAMGPMTFPRDAMQDTVGAIAWDSEGNLAAGVSSGGLLLKYSGRIGEAATFGAGCWAEQSQDGLAGMACSISGAGEHIIRNELARTIAGVLRPRQDGTEVDVHDVLMRTLSTQFHDPIMARGDTHPNAGVLLMTKEAQDAGAVIPRLWCAFTTESMAVAYANSEKLTAKVWKRCCLRVQRYEQKVLQGQNSTSSDSFATSPCDERLACLYHCSTTPWGRVIGLEMSPVVGNCSFADTVPNVHVEMLAIIRQIHALALCSAIRGVRVRPQSAVIEIREGLRASGIHQGRYRPSGT